MKSNSKKVIGILALIVLIIFVFLSLNNEGEKQEQVNTTKVETEVNSTSTASTTIGKDSLGAAEDGKTDKDDDPNEPILTPLGREIKPYTKEVPEQPDYEASRWNFIDTNNNKVHDYFEVLIVEEFEDDADLVESFFSRARVMERRLAFANEAIFETEDVRESFEILLKSSKCSGLYYVDSGLNLDDLPSDSDELLGDYYNTVEKLSSIRKLEVATHGVTAKSGIRTHRECQSFFKESLNW